MIEAIDVELIVHLSRSAQHSGLLAGHKSASLAPIVSSPPGIQRIPFGHGLCGSLGFATDVGVRAEGRGGGPPPAIKGISANEAHHA